MPVAKKVMVKLTDNGANIPSIAAPAAANTLTILRSQKSQRDTNKKRVYEAVSSKIRGAAREQLKPIKTVLRTTFISGPDPGTAADGMSKSETGQQT